MAVIVFGQGLPEAAGRGRSAPTQHLGHDAPAGTLVSQPDRVPFAPDEGPHFSESERFPVPLLGFFRP